MNIKRIIKFIVNPQTIKIVGLISIVGFFFIVPTFANNASANTDMSSLAKTQQYLVNFISVCSRLRIILAILAGKLMSNEFVYGAFLHMDVYLWKIWNIMKNFANFALVALVLGSIIKSLMGKEALDLKKILTNTLLAGILIQASWFLMGAVIDISTVATTAVGGFPSAFLTNDIGLKNTINESINKFKLKRIVVNQNADGDKIKTIPETEPATNSADIRKNIMPSYNSVSGPFIFLGMGVFKFQTYIGIDDNTNTTLPKLTLSFALQFFMIFFFTIGLLLLVIANVIRIGLLRVFIIGSPFLILMQIFKPKTGSGGIFKLFSFSNFLSTVFKPVIFVIGISLMLIVIVSIQKGITTSGAERESKLNGVSLSTSGQNISTLSVDGVTNITIAQNDVLGPNMVEGGKNFFSTVIMLLLTLFLMRWFIKLSLTTGGGTIADIMKDLTEKAERAAMTMPILPFKGGAASFGAIKKFGKTQKQKVAEQFGMNSNGQFTDAENNFEEFMAKKMGMKQNWTQKNYDTLNRLTNNENFMNKSIAIAQEKVDGLSLSNSTWSKSLETWLKSSYGIAKMKEQGASEFTGITMDLKTTLTTQPNASLYVKALHKLMGGNDALAPGGKNATTYEELMSNVYHKTTE